MDNKIDYYDKTLYQAPVSHTESFQHDRLSFDEKSIKELSDKWDLADKLIADRKSLEKEALNKMPADKSESFYYDRHSLTNEQLVDVIKVNELEVLQKKVNESTRTAKLSTKLAEMVSERFPNEQDRERFLERIQDRLNTEPVKPKDIQIIQATQKTADTDQER